MKHDIIEEQLVQVSYLVNVDTGDIMSTNEDYAYKKEYHRDFSFRRLTTWIRVKFIDSNDTFVGEAERVEKNKWTEQEITIFEKGEQVIISVDRVSAVEDTSKDFCYSDDVTQCSCPGTCRNK